MGVSTLFFGGIGCVIPKLGSGPIYSRGSIWREGMPIQYLGKVLWECGLCRRVRLGLDTCLYNTDWHCLDK